MAHQNATPFQQQLIWQTSYNFPALGSAPVPSKYIPKNPDGTVKDLSALTGLSMSVVQSGYRAGAFDLLGSITPTIDVADATGVTCHFAVSDPNIVAAAFGSGGAYQYTLHGTDGTNDYLVGQGILSLTILP